MLLGSVPIALPVLQLTALLPCRCLFWGQVRSVKEEEVWREPTNGQTQALQAASSDVLLLQLGAGDCVWLFHVVAQLKQQR